MSTSAGGTEPVAITQLTGYAQVRGLTVSVQVVSVLTDDAPDVEVFETLFEAAIAKVEQQD